MSVSYSYKISPGVEAALAAFKLPEKLGFGVVPAPVMYSAVYDDGCWSQRELAPFGEIRILPNARGLQFAESVFEGMKAYRRRPQAPHFFRPEANFERFSQSAARLGMPAVSAEIFFEGLYAVGSACADIVPDRSGASLYVRPVWFSTEPGYNVTGSKAFRFIVAASPSETYSSGPMRVRIEREDVRAARGGIGFAKTGGNYAAAMRATSAAVREGFTVSLWLDPIDRRYIDELSGMNVFAVVDGTLTTPQLTDSILPGVTRRSIIALAQHLGFSVDERRMAIDQLLEQIERGSCTEVFATGTAAVVSPIVELGDANGRRYALKHSPVADRLRSTLLGIQERREPDPLSWTCDLAALSDRSAVAP